ncbi:sugar transferase [Flavisphingomonas formosensis]|uniref:sugar transferase n=1 Tax=Flavisphingomonas formosensis TaxID=861534 RepID=UPI0012F909E0|nr:sugar transferase [Sphingomonas formosensis]
MKGARARDIAIAVAALPLLLPLLLLSIAAVGLIDGRPVFFFQMRSGLNGRSFRLMKLRSMTAGTEALADSMRITPLGRILRATRLDELPQLWHVLVGDMSIVGPRPLLPATVTQAGERGVARGRVRPGLTGWAQVNGNALLSDEDKFALDLWYVENRSHRLDWTIIVRTVLVILNGEQIDTTAIGRAYARGTDRRG